MAETKVQARPAETERNLTRRPEFSADLFSNSPFAIMRRFSEEMNRAFDSVFGGVPGIASTGAWSPAIEVRQHDGNLEIVAELPGLTKEDVKVESTENGLIIEGEKRQEREEREQGVYRSERSYGHFCRMVPLPRGAQADKATAEFKDGVLQVRVPVPEAKQNRKQIPIAA